MALIIHIFLLTPLIKGAFLRDAKQPKRHVTDYLQKDATGRNLRERLLNFTYENCWLVVGLFWASNVSDATRRLQTSRRT